MKLHKKTDAIEIQVLSCRRGNPWYWILCNTLFKMQTVGTQTQPSFAFCIFTIEHVYFENCLPIIFQYKPISLQSSWLSVEKPIRIDRLFYKRHWEFSLSKKTIPMLTCPIASDCYLQLLGIPCCESILLTDCINSACSRDCRTCLDTFFRFLSF